MGNLYPPLHVPSLLIVYQVVATLMTIFILCSACSARGRHGLWLWTAAFGIIALTQALRVWLVASGSQTGLYYIGHIGLVIASGLDLLAVRSFLGLKVRWKPVTLFVCAAVLFLASRIVPSWLSLSLALTIVGLIRGAALLPIFFAWRKQGGFALGLMAIELACSMAAHVLRAITTTPAFAGSAEQSTRNNSLWLLLFIGLLIFQGLAVLQLINGELQRSLTSMAETDSLTGLLNRRGFEGRFERLRERSLKNREAQTFAVAMLDIDHFKQINDLHGHGAGDSVLRDLGQVLLHQVRPTDSVVRLGGEEFAVIWQARSTDDVLSFADRLRQGVSDHVFNTESGPLRASVSVGVALPLHPRELLDDLLGRADKALYKAKRAGRNRVELAG